MSLTKGVLVFARNNEQIDYVKQAEFLAKRVRKYLNLPTSIVTDRHVNETVFDNVIVADDKINNKKSFYDGNNFKNKLTWKNGLRTCAYELSPYDETIVLDTDVVISNSALAKCFEQPQDFRIYKKSIDLVNRPENFEFKRLSDSGIEFYWATCIFFRKTDTNKIYFDLLKHIENNWNHYIKVNNILSANFRNDFVFSIGIHIMNGFATGSFASDMPGSLYHITDKSTLIEVKDNTMLFLLEKESNTSNSTLLRTKDLTVHVMNKFSLNRCIDE